MRSLFQVMTTNITDVTDTTTQLVSANTDVEAFNEVCGVGDPTYHDDYVDSTVRVSDVTVVSGEEYVTVIIKQTV